MPEQLFLLEKPETQDIGSHLSSRLNGEITEIEISEDEFNNRVIKSAKKTERTIAGDLQPQLIITDEGKCLIRSNHHLLRKIAMGKTGDELPFQGMESRVTKMNLSTRNGQEDFVLKYIFPMDIGGGKEGCYTPGIVTMKLLQCAKRENPVPGLNYAIPLLATYDVMLTKYIRGDLIDTFDLETIFTCDGVCSSMFKKLSKKAQDSVDEMLSDSEVSDRFYKNLKQTLDTASVKLAEWLKQKVKDNPEFSMHNIKSDGGMVCETDRLLKVFRKFKKDPKFNAGNQDFVIAVMECCYQIEIGIAVIEY